MTVLEQRVIDMAPQGLKPHAIARERMGDVPIDAIYRIIDDARRDAARGGPCWSEAEAALLNLGRDLTADDYVAALRDVTGREPRRISVLQQLSRRARTGIVERVGRGTYRILKDRQQPKQE